MHCPDPSRPVGKSYSFASWGGVKDVDAAARGLTAPIPLDSPADPSAGRSIRNFGGALWTVIQAQHRLHDRSELLRHLDRSRPAAIGPAGMLVPRQSDAERSAESPDRSGKHDAPPRAACFHHVQAVFLRKGLHPGHVFRGRFPALSRAVRASGTRRFLTGRRLIAFRAALVSAPDPRRTTTVTSMRSPGSAAPAAREPSQR